MTRCGEEMCGTWMIRATRRDAVRARRWGDSIECATIDDDVRARALFVSGTQARRRGVANLGTGEKTGGVELSQRVEGTIER